MPTQYDELSKLKQNLYLIVNFTITLVVWQPEDVWLFSVPNLSKYRYALY